MELGKIKGIGSARLSALNEAGIFTTDDLINYFPYKYYDFTKTEPFCQDGKVRLIKATAIEKAKVIRAKNGLSFVTCKMDDETGHTFTAMWFNQTYITNLMYLGDEFYLYGKNSPTKHNTFVALITKEASKLEKLGYLPVYKSIKGIGQKVLHDAICYLLQNTEFSALVPNKLLLKYNLLNLEEAYNEVHNPTSSELAESAFYRIEIENLIPLLAINEYNKHLYKVIKSQLYSNTISLEGEYEKLLPFPLTPDQKNAIFDIEKDMSSKFAMNRLLQGDVGSGKTLVGFFGAFVAAKNGCQSAFIAPTEILANQHYQTALKLFDGTGIEVVLLTGSVKGLERAVALSKIKNNKSCIVIGTHAVLSESVEFSALSYIVIDEQHRFGVEQRSKLKEKGFSPDILVMSATPIPRSLSLVVYGDLDISVIKSKPKPSKIVTNIVSLSKENDMWNYVSEKLKTGSRAYVVCAKIDEENEDDDVISYSAKSMYKKLESRFDGEELGLIHGKLSKESQNKLIEKFKQGKIKILVSTTIVEVGMDIPDADIMVIATPERFGLATLHQLRGRIGRNGEEAHCFCLAGKLSEKSYNRLLFFRNNQNGFDIVVLQRVF